MAEAFEEFGSTEQMTRQRRELTRLRQIQIGKARPEYRRYLEAVPVAERTPSQPRTPDHRTDASKRQFDRLLSTWRRSLHGWDESAGGGQASTLEAEGADDEHREEPERDPSARVIVSLEVAAADPPSAASRTPAPAAQAARRGPEDGAPARRISLADHVPHHSPSVPAYPSPQQANPWSYENFSPMRFPSGTPMTPAPRQQFNPYLNHMAETPETHKMPQTSIRTALNPVFNAQTPQDKFAMLYNQTYNMMMASPMMQGVSADTTPQRPAPQSLSIHMMHQMRQQEQMRLQMQQLGASAPPPPQQPPLQVPAGAMQQQQPQLHAPQLPQMQGMQQQQQQAIQQQQQPMQPAVQPSPALPAQHSMLMTPQPREANLPTAAETLAFATKVAEAAAEAAAAAAAATSAASSVSTSAAPSAASAPTLPLCESPVARRTLQQVEETTPRMFHSPTDAPCTPKRMTTRARSWSPPNRHGSGESATGAHRDQEMGRRGGFSHRDSPPPSVVKTPNPRCLVAETPSPTYHHYGQLASIPGLAPALPGVCRAMPFMPGM